MNKLVVYMGGGDWGLRQLLGYRIRKAKPTVTPRFQAQATGSTEPYNKMFRLGA